MDAPSNKNAALNNDCVLVSEHGVTVRNDYGKTPQEKQKLYNAKLNTFREIVLAALGIFCRRHQDLVYAADVVAASGLAGLQWKKHHGEKVHVTVADKDSVDKISENCRRNDFTPVIKSPDSTRIPGFPLESQPHNEIRVAHCTPNALMHLEAFHFLYIDPHKSVTNFVDSALFNVKNNGIISFVCSNISSFSRCPEVVQRQHTAVSTKTEFVKELAARIYIASIARVAACCNKGIEVLFVASVEDFLLISVQVHRGPRAADVSVCQLRRLLFCQMCEDKVFLPHRKATIEDPYSLLPCDCQKKTPGSTALELGPMWCGSIFNRTFLSEMLAEGTKLKLSTKFHMLVTSLLEEAGCGGPEHHLMSSSGEIKTASDDSRQTSNTAEEKQQHCKPTDTSKFEEVTGGKKQFGLTISSQMLSENSEYSVEGGDGVGDSNKNCTERIDNNSDSNKNSTDRQGSDSVRNVGSVEDMEVDTNHKESRKRSADSDTEYGKKPKLDSDESVQVSDKKGKMDFVDKVDSEGETGVADHCPAFYLSLERKKNYPGIIMPKVQRVVAFLKADGFSASRTHFSATAVRTSATHSQLSKVLMKYCEKLKSNKT